MMPNGLTAEGSSKDALTDGERPGTSGCFFFLLFWLADALVGVPPGVFACLHTIKGVGYIQGFYVWEASRAGAPTILPVRACRHASSPRSADTPRSK